MTNTDHTLPRPLPGKCYVEMTPETEGIIDGIYIPETAGSQRRIGYIGTVIAENPTARSLSNAIGRKCLFASWGGQRFHWQGRDLVVFDLSLEHFVAVYFDGDWIPLQNAAGHVEAPGEDPAIKRCRYCRSDGEGNILLDGDGVCHKCKRHADGRKHVQHRYKKTDGSEFTSDVEISDNDSVMDYLAESDKPETPKGTFISYPGMKKRS